MEWGRFYEAIAMISDGKRRTSFKQAVKALAHSLIIITHESYPNGFTQNHNKDTINQLFDVSEKKNTETAEAKSNSIRKKHITKRSRS